MTPIRVFLALACAFSPAWAGDGHDHDAAPAASAAPSAPRFAVVSARFELVGVAAGPQLTLYLDRFGDNRPAAAETIELTLDGKTQPLEIRAPGTYAATLPAPLGPGRHPVAVRLAAEGAVETLTGAFELAAAPAAAHPSHAPDWRAYAPWVGLALAGALLAVFLARRGRARHTGDTA